MSQPVFLQVTGLTQGLISQGACSADSLGSLKVDDQVDKIIAQAFSVQAIRPVDPQSNQPTGLVQCLPATVVKYIDSASPLLWNALTNGESLAITVEFYRTKPSGTIEHHYSMEFEEVTLVGLNPHVPHALLADSKPMRDMEEMQFTYGKVTMTHKVANKQAAYTWGKK